MAHNIANNKEMFSGEGILPWHGLGKVVEGLATAAEAIKHASMDWTVEPRPVYSKRDGGFVEIKDKFEMARSDNQDTLAIVGKRYCPIQNNEAFGFFDEVVGSGQAVYTTAGALGKGERTWILAKLPSKLFIDTRPDDATEKMILLTNSHDGTNSLTLQHVAVRVVCQNTLSMALGTKSNVIKIRHTKTYKNKVEEAQRVLKLIDGYYGDLQAVLTAMDKVEMNAPTALAFLETLVPDNEDSKRNTRTENVREEILTLFHKGAGNLGKTRYDMIQGVSDFVDHNRSIRVSDGDAREARFASAMFGSGNALKQRAFSMLAV